MKPKAFGTQIKTVGRWVALSIIPVAFLELLRGAAGAPFSLTGILARWGVIVGVLLAAQFGRLQWVSSVRWLWPWRGLLVPGMVTAAALGYAWTQHTGLAWLTLGGLYALLLIFARGYWILILPRRWTRFLARWVVVGVTAAVGGLAPVLIEQVETRFSDEEFFAFVSAVALSLFTGLLLGAHLWLSAQSKETKPPSGLRLNIRWALVGLALLTAAGGWATVRTYQTSFYPLEAPTFAGISADNPFLCGEMAPSAENSPDGADVFNRLLARIESNPRKGTPEFGMLALATRERDWAEAFRQAILSEAQENRFAGPAHSVKSIQYNAALRLYYLWKVQEAYPNLFTQVEQSLLRDWFAAVNERALTVEWVDWMYALAFSKWPEGPYENQENGAGLLALLEVSGYAAPELSAANQGYLARNPRGWQERFRNNDDAYVYQLEWLNNALFQSMYTGRLSEHNQRLSFEWLLLQSLPDGAILRYNHPARAPVVNMAYLGAQLLGDPHFLWMADQSLAQVEAEGRYLYAQPGLESPVSFSGEPPAETSCLLYSDSGLPNQLGPLAPDKIIFRDGWSPDAAYVMLNLRFAGWHRYKATNTITLLHQAGPLIEERTVGQPFAWLPEGRSLFRDKRIPRENLNGLLVERSGMSAALYELTGMGGPWAQDPPYYAQVVDFETGDELDWSHTRLEGWRGWQHDRWVYFYHQGGPVIVVDQAQGPEAQQTALVWCLSGREVVDDQRIQLRGGDDPAEMLLISLDANEISPGIIEHVFDPDILYLAPSGGRLHLATLFLFGEWVGAEASWESNAEGMILWVTKDDKGIALPLNQ